jgi:hypothetical protein
MKNDEMVIDPQGKHRRVWWDHNGGTPFVVIDGVTYPLNAGFDKINTMLIPADPPEGKRKPWDRAGWKPGEDGQG